MSKFIIGGKPYPVPEDLTLGEACTLEQEFGVDVQALGEGKGGLGVMAGFTWVAMHRVDSSVTPAQVKALNFSELDLSGIGGEEEDESSLPPSGAASAAERKVVASPGLATIRAASGSRAS